MVSFTKNTQVTFGFLYFQNEVGNTADETLVAHSADETVVHEKTLEENEKTIEAHENEMNEEKVTCVDEPEPEIAPLASMESDPAPLASLDSATSSELQSM